VEKSLGWEEKVIGKGKLASGGIDSLSGLDSFETEGGTEVVAVCSLLQSVAVPDLTQRCRAEERCWSTSPLTSFWGQLFSLVEDAF